jgi:hypothetical protein
VLDIGYGKWFVAICAIIDIIKSTKHQVEDASSVLTLHVAPQEDSLLLCYFLYLAKAGTVNLYGTL